MAFGSRGRGNLVLGVPREAFRPSGLFLSILALFVVSGVMLWTRFGSLKLDVILFVISGWVISLCLHEYAHALTAYRAGDLGVAQRGYLTLNPMKYTHPLLSIVLPLVFVILGGFGLPGGAVWIDHHYIRNKVHDTLISLAGPATNVFLALVTIAPFWFVNDPLGHLEFYAALAFLAFLQLTASVLNLFPIPGVDGGNALRPWIPYEWRRGFDFIAPWGMLAFILLLFNPVLNNAFFGLVYAIGDGLGLPRDLSAIGGDLFRFLSL
ncbi:MAG: site-2 protease family protein [Micromonosporaceae bacterium]|nr:site-2 protease family protein [Micromonosporaceae bacterium]